MTDCEDYSGYVQRGGLEGGFAMADSTMQRAWDINWGALDLGYHAEPWGQMFFMLQRRTGVHVRIAEAR